MKKPDIIDFRLTVKRMEKSFRVSAAALDEMNETPNTT